MYLLAAGWLQLALSVSTIGTNELQPRGAAHLQGNQTTFQFPQSERTNCNVSFDATKPALVIAFSFHNRNERTATVAPSLLVLRMRFFQFPQSERTNCNIVANTPLPVDLVFQFPQSERTNCNAARSSRDIKILRNFQFPQSERTNCNRRSEYECDAAECFQFPQSERTNCNATGTPTANASNIFQFPQSERTNCNFAFGLIFCAYSHSFSFHNRNERTATYMTIV